MIKLELPSWLSSPRRRGSKKSLDSRFRGNDINTEQFKKTVCFMTLVTCLTFLFSFVKCTAQPPATITPSSPTHGVSIFGDLKYPEGFTHYDYVNPDAPKGGKVKLGSGGSFDSFNPFIIKGTPAAGSTVLHCTLMDQAADEPNSMYTYLAEKIEIDPDRKGVTFTLRKEATFSDGKPVTADDVVFSFNILKEKGVPFFAQYYKDVKNIEKLDNHRIKFHFTTDQNRELPNIVGQFPVFSESFYKSHSFEKADLTVPVGCGPYKIANFRAGQLIDYERVPNWWGENIPSQKGQHNFDITYVFYRDQDVMFEAFKGGDYDFRLENIAKNWANGYKIPAVQEGKIIRQETENKLPVGMQIFTMNMRRSLFKDRKVREAIAKAFDFEWANKNLFFNAYSRTHSYFSNSPLASSGIPKGEELKILEPYKDQLPPEVFSEVFTLPVTDGRGRDRSLIEKASKILNEAAWVIKNGKRVHKDTGEELAFEFLLSDPAYERIALALQRNLASLGIRMTTRTVTPSEYIQRVGNYDYDMIFSIIPQSESPGNEQRQFWTSKYADLREGQNYSGVKDPIVDKLVELVIVSPDRPSLEARTHALDRVLLWGFYGVPTYHSTKSRVAYWNKFGQPKVKPKDGVGFNTWWIDPNLVKAKR